MPAAQPELGEAVAAAEAELEEADFLGRLRAGDPSLWRGDQAAIGDRLGWLPVVATMRAAGGRAERVGGRAAGRRCRTRCCWAWAARRSAPRCCARRSTPTGPTSPTRPIPAAVRASEHTRRALPGRVEVGRDARDALARGVLLGAHRRRPVPVCRRHRSRHRSRAHRARARLPAGVRRIPPTSAAATRCSPTSAWSRRRSPASTSRRSWTRSSATSRAPQIYGGAALGAALGGLARKGRNKVTIVAEGRFASFGLWAEQLLAESTGKEGTGPRPGRRRGARRPGGATAPTACSCTCAATARTTGRCTAWPRPATRC